MDVFTLCFSEKLPVAGNSAFILEGNDLIWNAECFPPQIQRAGLKTVKERMQSSRLELNLKLHKTVWVIYGPSLSWAKSCLPRPYYLLLHEVQPVIYDWSIEIGQSKNLNLFAAWALQSVKYLFLFSLPILMSKNEGKSGLIF